MKRVKVELVVTLSEGWWSWWSWSWRCRQINLIKGSTTTTTPACTEVPEDRDVCLFSLCWVYITIIIQTSKHQIVEPPAQPSQLSLLLLCNSLNEIYFHKNCHQTTGYCRLWPVASRNARTVSHGPRWVRRGEIMLSHNAIRASGR